MGDGTTRALVRELVAAEAEIERLRTALRRRHFCGAARVQGRRCNEDLTDIRCAACDGLEELLRDRRDEDGEG